MVVLSYPTPKSVFSTNTSILLESFKFGYTSSTNHFAKALSRLRLVEFSQNTFTLAYSKYCSASAISLNIRSLLSPCVQHNKHTP